MVILDTKYFEHAGEVPEGRLQFRILEEFIVQYTLSGPVDRILMECFSTIHQEAVGRMKKSKGAWGSFVMFHNVTKVSDGALEELGRYLSELGERGKLSAHMAVVFPSDLSLSMKEREAFCDCLVGVGVVCQSFAREEDAIKWLRCHTGI